MGLTDEELNYKERTDLPPREQARADSIADKLRMKFIKEWALKRNIDLYQTDAERDWAYIVRREYRYNVLYRAFFDGLFFGSVLQTLYTWQRKQVQFKPLLVVPLIMLMRVPSLYKQHHRRYFETLNLGTEYELGAERNRILEECNRISARADV